VPPATTERAADAPEGAPRRRWRPATIVQAGLVLAIAGFWGGIYAYTLSVDEEDIRPPGRMTDRAFAAAAEPICAATAAEIGALGLPTAVDDAAERAELVQTENVLLRSMLGDLGELDRPTGQEGRWVEEWLRDWDVHVEDRQRWADDLRAGDDGPFVETDRGGEQISKGVDYFAETNSMPSCATAGDV
jgi:hypothetical protein